MGSQENNIYDDVGGQSVIDHRNRVLQEIREYFARERRLEREMETGYIWGETGYIWEEIGIETRFIWDETGYTWEGREVETRYIWEGREVETEYIWGEREVEGLDDAMRCIGELERKVEVLEEAIGYIGELDRGILGCRESQDVVGRGLKMDEKNRGNGAFGVNATSSRVSKGYKHRIWTRKRVTMVREMMGYRKERELVKSPWKQEKNRKTDGKLIKSLWKQKTNMKEEGELVRSLWKQEKTRERERGS